MLYTQSVVHSVCCTLGPLLLCCRVVGRTWKMSLEFTSTLWVLSALDSVVYRFSLSLSLFNMSFVLIQFVAFAGCHVHLLNYEVYFKFHIWVRSLSPSLSRISLSVFTCWCHLEQSCAHFLVELRLCSWRLTWNIQSQVCRLLCASLWSSWSPESAICQMSSTVSSASSPLEPVHFLSLDQQSGIHCLIICTIQLLTSNNLGGTSRCICSPEIWSVSTLEVLRFCTLQIDIYLPT